MAIFWLAYGQPIGYKTIQPEIDHHEPHPSKACQKCRTSSPQERQFQPACELVCWKILGGCQPDIVFMKITFGQTLDGTELLAQSNSIGDVVCGPLRFTEILETQLGLKRKPVSEITRVFQFVKVLEKLAESKHR